MNKFLKNASLLCLSCFSNTSSFVLVALGAVARCHTVDSFVHSALHANDRCSELLVSSQIACCALSHGESVSMIPQDQSLGAAIIDQTGLELRDLPAFPTE